MIRDVWETIRAVKAARACGVQGKLMLISQDDFAAMQQYGADMLKHYRLAYECIETMGDGKSRCRYCMDRDECKSPKRGNLRGCSEWILKFPKEENDEQTAAAEDRAAEQENQETEPPRADA